MQRKRRKTATIEENMGTGLASVATKLTREDSSNGDLGVQNHKGEHQLMKIAKHPGYKKPEES